MVKYEWSNTGKRMAEHGEVEMGGIGPRSGSGSVPLHWLFQGFNYSREYSLYYCLLCFQLEIVGFLIDLIFYFLISRLSFSVFNYYQRPGRSRPAGSIRH